MNSEKVAAAEAFYQQGNEARKRGQWHEAINNYIQAIALHALTKMMVTVGLMTAVAIVTEAAPLQRKQLLNDQWQFVENDSDFTKAQSVVLPHEATTEPIWLRARAGIVVC